MKKKYNSRVAWLYFVDSECVNAYKTCMNVNNQKCSVKRILSMKEALSPDILQAPLVTPLVNRSHTYLFISRNFHW